MLALEQRYGSKDGPNQAMTYLQERQRELHTSYERLVLNLQRGK